MLAEVAGQAVDLFVKRAERRGAPVLAVDAGERELFLEEMEQVV